MKEYKFILYDIEVKIMFIKLPLNYSDHSETVFYRQSVGPQECRPKWYQYGGQD